MKNAFGRLIPTPRPDGLPGPDDFWAWVNFLGSPTGCWIWCGKRTKFGHGVYMVGGRAAPAHRVASEVTAGPISFDQVVRHSCDNAPCVNPAHLQRGTADENRADMVRRGRAPWQRLRDPRENPILRGVLNLWAQAHGVDPYTLSLWMWQRQPMPESLLRIMQEELGLPVHPTELGAGL